MVTREKKDIVRAVLLDMQKDHKVNVSGYGTIPYSGICAYIDSYFKKPPYFINWVCPEYYEFVEWFQCQRPTLRKNKQFFEEYKKDSVWWWTSYIFEPREAFLKHLIKKRIRKKY